ncbi:MAG: ATP-grasp domain-containing protein [Opitutae bacterium]|nr:ATP-grasp domain-containing protein [Opitutae bacterium]
MMKNILITAGGSAAAFFFAKQIRKFSHDGCVIHIADINPRELVAASTYADHFHQVPKICDVNYRSSILDIVKKYQVELMVPLIDQDLIEFPGADSDLMGLGCISTAPTREVSEQMTDKVNCSVVAEKMGIPVPEIYGVNDIEDSVMYFCKPRVGFGSRGVMCVRGDEIRSKGLFDKLVVQELCEMPEITMEVFSHAGVVRTLCRERVEVKAGVCTKARIFQDEELHRYAELIVGRLELPVATCIQFMKHPMKGWVLTDANMRIGAGSALCAAVGWDLAGAALAAWSGNSDLALESLQFEGSERYVVRVFEEIVTK